MSYTPTNWQTGGTITAEKLNNMEGGIENANNPFIVNCTPTAADYSGVMDKTVAEIDAAYRAGRRIVFRLLTGADTYQDVSLNDVGKGNRVYPSFNAICSISANNADTLFLAFTGITDDGTQNTYATKIFPLTPMS